MKKSEFLNKTKEELQAALNELSELGYLDEEDDESIQLIKLLLSNDGLLKMTAKDREGRAQLCVLAETAKGLVGFLRNVEKIESDNFDLDALSESEILHVLTNSGIEGAKKAVEVEAELEDDDEEDFDQQSMIDSLVDDVAKAYDLDEEEVAEIRQGITNSFNEKIKDDYDYLGSDDKDL